MFFVLEISPVVLTVKGRRADGMAALQQVRPKLDQLQLCVLEVLVIVLLFAVSLLIYSD